MHLDRHTLVRLMDVAALLILLAGAIYFASVGAAYLLTGTVE